MKNKVIKFGLYSAGLMMGLNLISLIVFGTDPENFGWGEVVGYSIIILSMVFVFLGVREYGMESEELNFWQALKIGSLITLIPSLIFGIYNIIYVKWIDPNFFENYSKYQIAKMDSPSQEEILAIQAQINDMSNPFAMFIMMFLTVFLIGFIVSIISSFILKSK